MSLFERKSFGIYYKIVFFYIIKIIILNKRTKMNRILLLLFVVIVVGTTTNNCNGKKLIATTAFLVSPCSNKMVNVDIDDSHLAEELCVLQISNGLSVIFCAIKNMHWEKMIEAL